MLPHNTLNKKVWKIEYKNKRLLVITEMQYVRIYTTYLYKRINNKENFLEKIGRFRNIFLMHI